MTTELQHDADAAEPGATADPTPQPTPRVLPDLDAEHQLPTSPVRIARFAGLLYLVIAVFGGFAQGVRLSVYEPGDGAATAANLVAHATLVRLSFVADLVQCGWSSR